VSEIEASSATQITMKLPERDSFDLLPAIESKAVVVRLGGEVWRLPIATENIARDHLRALARVLDAANAVDQ
jgi:hypothetical protein